MTDCVRSPSPADSDEGEGAAGGGEAAEDGAAGDAAPQTGKEEAEGRPTQYDTVHGHVVRSFFLIFLVREERVAHADHFIDLHSGEIFMV